MVVRKTQLELPARHNALRWKKDSCEIVFEIERNFFEKKKPKKFYQLMQKTKKFINPKRSPFWIFGEEEGSLDRDSSSSSFNFGCMMEPSVALVYFS